MIKLGILDQLPIREGGKPADPIDEAIELARLAEDWGYQRYWTAQFHGTVSFTSAAPELVCCRLAAETRSMRIGAGGILLSNFSPYVVAEQFRMLETFFPGRIDLGIGRTTGADAPTHAAILYGSNRGAESFPQKVHDLKAFLGDGKPLEPAWSAVKATPVVDTPPAVWLLGSGETSAAHAAEQGLAVSFAHFINPYIYDKVLEDYRARFQPSGLYARPQANVCVFVVCADTEEEARRLSLSRDQWWLEVFEGKDPPYRSVESVLSNPFSAAQQERLKTKRDATVIGTPEQVRDQLLEIATRAKVDELLIQTMTFDYEARKKSFRLVSEAMKG